MSQPIGACCLVFNTEGKVLLGKRKNAFGAGLYGLPGGRIELGEKVSVTAVRELKEETGILNARLSYQGVVKELQGDVDFIHFVFVIKDWEGEITVMEPEKCEAWEWFNLDDLPKNILPGHEAALQLYQEDSTLWEL